MKGPGKWGAGDFWIWGLGNPPTQVHVGTTWYGWRNYELTQDAKTYQGGCIGLVALRIGSPAYSKDHYFYTDIKDATKKAAAIGEKAMIYAMQSNAANKKTWGGGIVYEKIPEAGYPSRVKIKAQYNSGYHSTWIQTSAKDGYWETLINSGWVGEAFWPGANARFVEHNQTLPAYAVTIYGVATITKKTRFTPAWNGPLTPTAAPP